MSESATECLPWGETLNELAAAVLADKYAPPVLVFAAFRARHGDANELRALIAEAVALNTAEKMHRA